MGRITSVSIFALRILAKIRRSRSSLPILRLLCTLFVASSLASAEINRLQLGSHIDLNAATFRVYSSHATRIELDLFREPFGANEVSRIPLERNPSTSVWSVSIPVSEIRKNLKIKSTIYYGYRAWRPNWTYDPA